MPDASYLKALCESFDAVEYHGAKIAEKLGVLPQWRRREPDAVREIIAGWHYYAAFFHLRDSEASRH